MWVTCSRAMCLAQCVLMLLRGLEKRVQQPSQGGAVSPVLLLRVLTVRTLPAAWLGWGWRLEPRQLAHTGLETGVGSGLDRGLGSSAACSGWGARAQSHLPCCSALAGGPCEEGTYPQELRSHTGPAPPSCPS